MTGNDLCSSPDIILVNPWIYDFAAFDLWAKPLGLLYIASYLRQAGFGVHLVDCLDIHHPKLKTRPSIPAPVRRRFGTGKFLRQRIPVPQVLTGIKRSYYRYGMPVDLYREELAAVKEPAAIVVTSLMTYWYPGVYEAIRMAREVHPDVPVIMGGIYASLCREHAGNAGADVVTASRDPESLVMILKDQGIFASGVRVESAPHCFYPAFDMLHGIDYICIASSVGCPFRCQYCASHFLRPQFIQRKPEEVTGEILYWHKKFGIRDFAFYDDALLISSETHIVHILQSLEKYWGSIRFHTPNAVHIKGISRKLANLMYRAGFKTIRLGLESYDISFHNVLDKKVAEGEFEQAVRYLFEAGFKGSEIGAYILMGLPGQSVDSVVETVRLVDRAGVFPYLAEYSPLPHTELWDTAVKKSGYDLVSEPLFHNNTLVPCWDDSQKKEIPRLKSMVLDVRKRHAYGAVQ